MPKYYSNDYLCRVIAIGEYNVLKILRDTSVGLYLGDGSGEDVLLPNKYCPAEFELGDRLEVFVYLDYEERKVATNIEPKIYLNEFALLEVSSVESVGAFMDWGLEKELLVPFSEQRQKMEQGRWYVCILKFDEKTDRLYASNKIEKHLSNEELELVEKEEVDILIYRKTEIGYSVIINHMHKGLVYQNEIFQELKIGDEIKGYVKRIREDNKIDISLQPIGFKDSNDKNEASILALLEKRDGYLPFNDKSSPEEISDYFGMSKKAFKKSIGTLYRQKQILIEKEGIRWTNNNTDESSDRKGN